MQVGTEYVMKLLPRGTHDYAKFIRPSELCRAINDAGLEVKELRGLTYNPFSKQASLVRSVDANYLVHAKKPA